jgi:hypothetical protein
MKFTIYLALIILLTSSFSTKKEPIKIEYGIYDGFSKDIVHKSTIIKVENSVAYIESYILWQGVWMPSTFSKGKYYEPIKLTSENNIFKNETMTFINNGKKYKLKCRKTFIGKLKMNLEMVNELDSKTNSIRNEALLFSCNIKTFKNKEDSISFQNLNKEINLNHTLFLQKLKDLVE